MGQFSMRIIFLVGHYCMRINTLFDSLLDKYKLNEVISIFQKERKCDTDSMFDLSYKNFSSLNKSFQQDYNKKWHISRELASRIPNYWATEYDFISFSNLKLSYVKKRIDVQRKILSQINLSSKNIYQLVRNMIDEYGSIKQDMLTY